MGSLKKGWRRMKVATEGIRNMVVEEIRNMVVGIRRMVAERRNTVGTNKREEGRMLRRMLMNPKVMVKT